MQRVRHLLNARLLQTFFQDRQCFVERHPCLQQMGDLLRKNEQLAVGNFQSLRGRRGRSAVSAYDFRLRGD